MAHAGTVTYVYTDPQGTPLAEADAQGNIIARFDYSPYGSIALGTAPNGPGYTGHVNDPETGLVYMQQRYDDPSGGRFLSPDQVGVSPGDVFSFNRYAYANSNPLRYTDPSGRCAEYYSKKDGGGCKVDVDPSLTKSKQAQAARRAVEGVLNKYDKAINALSDGKSYSVFTKNSRHRTEAIGHLTGKQIKALWNGQHFSIVSNGTYMSSNGGVGGAVPGHTALEPQGVLGYQVSSSVATEIFHEFGHITPAGLQMTRMYGDAPIRSPEYIEREQKASTVGSVIASSVQAPFLCSAIEYGCF
ncbi:hypothetical protein UU5_03682 [Rhodanobacter sp. 115]|nr:hypothetical protein UU5_03682 [Rhodanobacter sp. 115]